MVRFFRKYHKWFSIAATFFILLFAVSGIILNHRKALSGLDVSRGFLPRNYHYRNWNLAAVKGAVRISSDSILIYGNTGIWLTDSSFSRFRDMNAGFPDGADNRKINTLSWSPRTGLFAGSLFGLFQWRERGWHKVLLPESEPRVVKVLAQGDTLFVMTRSHLWLSGTDSKFQHFSALELPKGENDDGKTGLFKTLWVIHSGEIYGLPGKLIVDGVGIVFILLSFTGLIYFLMPTILRRVKSEERKGKSEERKVKFKRFNRGALRWHNTIGSWMIAILLLNTVTGMFLRPPLLIPVADKRVGKLPYTELSDPNPWFDRLRDLIFDPGMNRFLLSTSEGMYYSDDFFQSELKFFVVQPPVSVMGINVFRKVEPGTYLVGSFSGLFEWTPDHGTITDAVTRTPYRETGGSGPPFGSVSVAGLIDTDTATSVVFDYAAGAFALTGRNPFPSMPEQILSASPMSLWSACLEIHTGRIFEPIFGMFYILVVPLVGFVTLFILVSGFWVWWRAGKLVSW
jgi:hypothetical protein